MQIIGTTQCCDTITETASLTTAGGCIYCSPPAGISSLTEAMPGKYTTYEEYTTALFQYIDSMQPQILYIEAGVTNRELLLQTCRQYFKHVDIDECRAGYRTSRRCWIIRCGKAGPAPHPDRDNMGTRGYIRWICKQEIIDNITHIYMTDGWLEFQGYKNEKKIISVLKSGFSPERLKNLIADYDTKQAERERERERKNKIKSRRKRNS